MLRNKIQEEIDSLKFEIELRDSKIKKLERIIKQDEKKLNKIKKITDDIFGKCICDEDQRGI